MLSLEKLKLKIRPGHVLHTLVSEHDLILDFLGRLERLNEKIQEEGVVGASDSGLAELKDVAEHLVGAEPHHKREEDVLFPELEERGFFGPTSVMRQEHEELRAGKKTLLELAASPGDLDSFKRNLRTASQYIIPVLRVHIDKENKILYPAAFETIKEKSVWLEMKKRCDVIGYCCFTPKN